MVRRLPLAGLLLGNAGDASPSPLEERQIGLLAKPSFPSFLSRIVVEVPMAASGLWRMTCPWMPSRLSLSSSCCRRTRAFTASGCSPQAGAAPTLIRVQRRIGRLNTLHRSLVLPRLQQFVAQGRMYDLPMRARTAPLQDISERDLQYLVGFFDGDGCVSCSPEGCVDLSVTQSSARPQAMLFLLSTLGGGVYAKAPGRGPVEPTLQWRLSGKAASRVAQAMLRVPSVKRPQLELVSSSYFSTASRVAVRERLRQLKRDPTLTPDACSWPYVAGFFDAEGCVVVQPHCVSLMLQIGQKHPGALLSLRSFLQAELPAFRFRMAAYQNLHCLSLYGIAVCQQLLTRLLEAGLTVKREAAEAALTLTASSHVDVRSKISALGGNQSRYMRLDDDGRRRAGEISRFCRQLNRCRSMSECERTELKQKLADLKEEHELACATRRLQLLRSDIRSLLHRGATKCSAGRQRGADRLTQRGAVMLH